MMRPSSAKYWGRMSTSARLDWMSRLAVGRMEEVAHFIRQGWDYMPVEDIAANAWSMGRFVVDMRRPWALVFKAVAAGADLRYGSCNGAYKGTEVRYSPSKGSAAYEDIEQVTADVMRWYEQRMDP